MSELNITANKSNKKNTNTSKDEDKSSNETPGGQEEQEKPKKPKKPKVSAGTIETELINFLERKNPAYRAPHMPEFDLRYKPWNVWFKKDDRFVRCLKLNHETQTAEELLLDGLTAEILDHTEIFAGEDVMWSRYCLSDAQAERLAKRMFKRGRRCPEHFWPFPVGFLTPKSKADWCFHRLDFDPVKGATRKQFPFISEMLNRLTNWKAFCNRVAGIYDPKADRKQIVYIYGPGDTGKSTIFKILQELAGGKNGYASFDETVSTNKFGMLLLVGKRVLLGSEIRGDFFVSKKSKRLTGGDALPVEGKGQNQFTAHLDALIFINSNEAPSFPNDTGLKNRVVICNMSKISGGLMEEAEANQHAKDELKYFLGYCLDNYERGRLVMDDMDDMESAISSYESSMESLFDAILEDDLTADKSNPKLTSKDFWSLWDDVKRNSPYLLTDIKKTEWQNYIKRRTGRDGKPFSLEVRTPDGPKEKDRFILYIRKKRI